MIFKERVHNGVEPDLLEINIEIGGDRKVGKAVLGCTREILLYEGYEKQELLEVERSRRTAG